jgi:hypothetical protein
MSLALIGYLPWRTSSTCHTSEPLFKRYCSVLCPGHSVLMSLCFARLIAGDLLLLSRYLTQACRMRRFVSVALMHANYANNRSITLKYEGHFIPAGTTIFVNTCMFDNPSISLYLLFSYFRGNFSRSGYCSSAFMASWTLTQSQRHLTILKLSTLRDTCLQNTARSQGMTMVTSEII